MAKKMGYDVGTPQPTSITILIRKGNYTRVWLPKKNAANAASRIVQCELCSKSKKDLPIKIFFFFIRRNAEFEKTSLGVTFWGFIDAC